MDQRGVYVRRIVRDKYAVIISALILAPSISGIESRAVRLGGLSGGR